LVGGASSRIVAEPLIVTSALEMRSPMNGSQ
jgi:hypothetical protein